MTFWALYQCKVNWGEDAKMAVLDKKLGLDWTVRLAPAGMFLVEVAEYLFLNRAEHQIVQHISNLFAVR